MKYLKLIVGQLQTNCYLAWNEKTSDAIIIDPGDDADFIINKIRDHNLKPIFIVATHGHFDHILAVTELKLAYNLPFLLAKEDLFLLDRVEKSSARYTQTQADPPSPPDKFLEDGMTISIGNEKVRVIATPGHTPGSISLYQDNVLFSGDTLFYHDVGRTDLPYSSPKLLCSSLKTLFKLPPESQVLPGHGEESTIEEEKNR